MPQVAHHINGREYWLSLEQLAQTPEFQERAAQEFPGYDPDELLGLPRRRFLKLMGGSMALAGLTLTGCRRWPKEQLAPYASRPEDRIPGVSEHYATAMALNGVSTGLLVSSYDGRPIKVEGNPQHPFSLGASDMFAQASVLDLYDPDRGRGVLQRRRGEARSASWRTFEAFAEEHFATLRDAQGEGFAVLSEALGGPTELAMKARLLKAFPKCRWYTYEPIHCDNAIAGSRLAFDQALRPLYHLGQAAVIALFDADLLGSHPAKLKHARDWAMGRKSADQGRMNRLYVAESRFSTTGSVADHRFPARPARVAQLLVGVGNRLGLPGLPADDLNAEEARCADLVAKDLQRGGGHSVVAVGESMAPWAHALAHRINARLGAIGNTVTLVADPHGDAPLYGEDIQALTGAMTAGAVNTLLVLGGNPAYDAPADTRFAAALEKVATSIHLGLYVNETSAACSWRLPRAHYLEAWNDGRSWDGTITTSQPLIEPLYEGKSVAELLALVIADEVTAGYDLVRRTLADEFGGGGFEKVWRQTLHAGVRADSAFKTIQPKLTTTALAIPANQPAGEFDMVLTVDPSVYDGRFANNGWLQETPDPLTKVTWDNPLLINKADADRLGIATGDMVAVTVGQNTLNMAAYLMPGQPTGVVSAALGYGRSVAGNIGTQVGFNTYALRTLDAPHHAGAVRVSKTGARYVLALTQDHHFIDPVGAAARDQRVGPPGQSGSIIREASLKAYQQDPDFVHRDVHGNISLQLFDPPSQFNDPHAWGMAVDMTACIGCNACVVACQAENNIPVVGKEEVARSREMQWLRIDRYFKGDPVASPEVVHQPMMCVHCENAPCEQVCPVGATMHDSEGLNTMVYNRCIGTRYCSNNCPYKVRRFNYFDFHSKDARGQAQPWLGIPDTQQQNQVDEIKRMVFNPDVTVRMRGVMEKCTYCVQRISAARITRRNAGEEIQDGDVVTACQQSCPTQAIVFGDLNDPKSAVRKLHQNHRAYGVLAELNVRPRTKFLAKVINPVEEQADA